MKQRLFSLTLSMFTIFLAFQNCSRFEAGPDSTFYLYSERPTFFADVQFIGEDEIDNQFRYNYDIVVSNAADPRETIDYVVRFVNVDGDDLCPAAEGQANNTNNHFTYECITPVRQDDIFVQVLARNPQGEEDGLAFHF